MAVCRERKRSGQAVGDHRPGQAPRDHIERQNLARFKRSQITARVEHGISFAETTANLMGPNKTPVEATYHPNLPPVPHSEFS